MTSSRLVDTIVYTYPKQINLYNAQFLDDKTSTCYNNVSNIYYVASAIREVYHEGVVKAECYISLETTPKCYILYCTSISGTLTGLLCNVQNSNCTIEKR